MVVVIYTLITSGLYWWALISFNSRNKRTDKLISDYKDLNQKQQELINWYKFRYEFYKDQYEQAIKREQSLKEIHEN